jgi:hypothetical protein
MERILFPGLLGLLRRFVTRVRGSGSGGMIVENFLQTGPVSNWQRVSPHNGVE